VPIVSHLALIGLRPRPVRDLASDASRKRWISCRIQKWLLSPMILDSRRVRTSPHMAPQAPAARQRAPSKDAGRSIRWGVGGQAAAYHANLSRTRITCAADHLPPNGAGTPRVFSSSAAFLADKLDSRSKTLRRRSARSFACRC
jgi:hypothetical protein